MRLVPVSFEDPEFKSSFSQSFSLYVKYQMAIHQDPPDECGKTEVPFVTCFPVLMILSMKKRNVTFLCCFFNLLSGVYITFYFKCGFLNVCENESRESILNPQSKGCVLFQ